MRKQDIERFKEFQKQRGKVKPITPEQLAASFERDINAFEKGLLISTVLNH